MSEYIPTFKACNLLHVPLHSSYLLTKIHKVRSRKDFNQKFWNLDDINAIIKVRKAKSRPPKGYITNEEAADLLHRSIGVARAVYLANGLPPTRMKLWCKTRYRSAICWNRKEAMRIARAYNRTNHTLPPEGWLSMSDCKTYLGMNRQKAAYWIKKYGVAKRRINKRRYHYAEDDIVALRRQLKTTLYKTPY